MEFAYAAEVAGLSYSIFNSVRGLEVRVNFCSLPAISLNIKDFFLKKIKYSSSLSLHPHKITVRGYNDKLGVLLNSIIEKVLTLNIEPKRFEEIKDTYARSLKSFEVCKKYVCVVCMCVRVFVCVYVCMFVWCVYKQILSNLYMQNCCILFF